MHALQSEHPLQIGLDDWVTLTSLCKRAQKTTDDTSRLFLSKALLDDSFLVLFKMGLMAFSAN